MIAIRSKPFTRVLACCLLAICMSLGPGFAAPSGAQESGGAIHGVLYQPDGVAKLAGGKVIAIDVKTGKQYVSNVTDESGAYTVTGLPITTFDIVVEWAGGTYIADKLIGLAPNQNLAASYSVQPQKPASRKVAGVTPPKGSAVPVGGFRGASPAAGTTGRGAREFWTSPGGITLISVLGVGVALVIANNIGDGGGSPSTP